MPRDVVLVTGASSDLGLALIRRLVSRPQPPLVLAHHHAGLERVEALRRELGADHLRPIAADFTSAASVVAMAERVEAEHGVPAQLVHLPALKLVQERFPKMTWEHFQQDLEVQIHSAVLLLQRFLPRMAKLPGARVVFVLSSVTRGVPPKFLSMYTVIKHAQLGLMKALASEYSGTKVTVNAVSPGMVATRFLENLPEIAVQIAAKQTPLGRHATTDDVTGAIAFLLSPDASYISGAEIPITAGQTG